MGIRRHFYIWAYDRLVLVRKIAKIAHKRGLRGESVCVGEYGLFVIMSKRKTDAREKDIFVVERITIRSTFAKKQPKELWENTWESWMDAERALDGYMETRRS